MTTYICPEGMDPTEFEEYVALAAFDPSVHFYFQEVPPTPTEHVPGYTPHIPKDNRMTAEFQEALASELYAEYAHLNANPEAAAKEWHDTYLEANAGGDFEWGEFALGQYRIYAEMTKTSWSEEDFEDILTGTYVKPVAPVLTREDGFGLFYLAAVNELHGESESGKSWIALAASLQTIAKGQHVRYIDYESSRETVVGRMLLLGAKRDDLRAYFHYYRPEVLPDRKFRELLEQPSTLTVVDGVTEAISMAGFNPNDSTDIAKWMADIPKALSRKTGAAVVLIDHVVKSSDGRGRFMIGSQHKMAAIDGASYYVDVEQMIAPGKVGTLLLKVAKDRPGAVREVSGPADAHRMQTAAVVELDSSIPAFSHITVKNADASHRLAKAAKAHFEYRDKITSALETAGSFTSKKALSDHLGAGYGRTSQAFITELEALQAEGLISVDEAVNGKSAAVRWVGTATTEGATK